MNEFKNKKTIGIIIILSICLLSSFLIYSKNRNNIFKEQYMDNIFIDEDTEEVFNNIDNETSNNKNINYDKNKENEDINYSEDQEISKKNEIVVEIKGEVLNPDVYTLEEGSIIKDLIELAGGLTNEADISNINRAKELQNHQLIVIANTNNKDEINPLVDEVNNISSNEEENGMININTASESELKNIPGVGEVKAKAIIEYRENNNGFKALDEMKNIDGIGDKTFEKMKDKITL